MDETQQSPLSLDQVHRAIRISYLQAMLGTIYVASNGGMFIIGYALKLGADNVQIGMMSTVPMLFVVVQLLSALLVERGVSRKKLTIAAGLFNVLGWVLIIVIPYVLKDASNDARVIALIGVLSLATAFAYISGNARASWIGDLIPEDHRGMFFGKIVMYAGIIGAIIAVGEGRLLDHLKEQGIDAFNALFLFGMLFGLASTLLFIPQADVPITRHESSDRFWSMVKGTFSNHALMMVMLYWVIWNLQSMAGPFYATYMLRDLKMPYLGFGILNGISTMTMLLSSPFWGRMVDRYGAKPILVACTSVIIPIPLVWIWLTNVHIVYAVIAPLNLLSGFIIAGVSVAMSTLIYKVTPNAGRSVQFAVYSVAVLLLAAPMPTIGGYLPAWLKTIGIQADLRYTFYANIIFLAGAALAARRIHEPNASGARELVRNLPVNLIRRHLAKPND